MFIPLRPFTFALLCLLCACASGERTIHPSAPILTSAQIRERYQTAAADYKEGDYPGALVTIENVLERMGDSPEREELLFIRADSYLQLKDYHDAELAYRDYLDAYPQGRYRQIITQDQVRLAAERGGPQSVGEERIEAARRDLNQLLELEREYPRDPQIKYRIGNLYYETEDYEKAGHYYFEAQSLEAAYKEKDLIQQRLYIDGKGDPKALTPAALTSLAKEKQPLVVFDVYPYRERGVDSFNARLVYANVSGKVRNQGESTLREVVLEVRFLNALGDVLDVETIAVGTLPPGGVRAFLASARHYDNLFNITDVEVVPRGA